MATKILKNTTVTDISLVDLGVTILTNNQITLSPNDYLDAADSDELVELIGDGSIIINDGNLDLPKAQGMSLIQSGFTKTAFDDVLLDGTRLKVAVTGTLGDGQVSVSSNDDSSSFLDNKIYVGSSKLSKTILNPSGFETIELDVVTNNINTQELNNDANFINASQAPVQPTDIVNFETTAQLDIRDTNNRNRVNHTGTQLSVTISDFNSAVQSSETDTTLTFNNTTKILSYTNEAGTVTNVDLTQFLDDTNLSYITSGVLDPVTGIVTFTRDDTSTFTVDFSSLNDQSFINAVISTHESSIDNHDDVDTTTNSPTLNSRLKWDGSDWIPSVEFKEYAEGIVGLINNTPTFEPYPDTTLTPNIPTAGLYEITWDFSWSLNSTGTNFESRIYLDNSIVLGGIMTEPKDAAGTGTVYATTTGGTLSTGTDQEISSSGRKIVSLSTGEHTIELQFATQNSGSRAAIHNGTLTIRKWDL